MSTETREMATLDQHEEAVSLLAIIGNAALNPQVDVEKMRALLELKERIDDNAAKKLFHAAMIDAQEEMRPVVRDRMNDHTKSKYATLEAVDRAIRPIYTKHGFSLSFNSREGKEGMITILCDCMHRGGYAKEYELTGALDGAGPSGTKNKTGIQAAGSSSQYLRRYLTTMIFNLIMTDEDDDGSAGATFISDDQIMRLEDLISASEMDAAARAVFLKFMGVQSLSKLPQQLFVNAHENLKAKHRQHLKAQGK